VEKLKKQSELLKSQQSSSNRDQQAAEDHHDVPLDREAWAQLVKDEDRNSAMQQRSDEFLKARAELLKTRRAVNVLTGNEATQVSGK
jgi:hypothetical protein